jgi:beta-glucoside operon transcriptional antiterminator
MANNGEVTQPTRLAVHKVLNNNVVISLDSSGHERVLMGRGLGFQVRPGESIDAATVEKTFVLDVPSDADHTRAMLAAVPYPVVDAVVSAVDEAERSLGRSLGRRIPLAIIDHVQYVLERLKQGVRIPVAAMPELRVLYPEEFRTAAAMADFIGARLQIELPEEESVFLTMHLLNATRDEPNGSAALLFRRLQHVVGTVERGLGVNLDVQTPDYARFILHVQFLLQRLGAETMLRGGDTSFFEFAKRSYPQAYEIATEVKSYVRAATGSELTDEEVLYIIVHVERLATTLGAPRQ